MTRLVPSRVSTRCGGLSAGFAAGVGTGAAEIDAASASGSIQKLVSITWRGASTRRLLRGAVSPCGRSGRQWHLLGQSQGTLTANPTRLSALQIQFRLQKVATSDARSARLRASHLRRWLARAIVDFWLWPYLSALGLLPRVSCGWAHPPTRFIRGRTFAGWTDSSLSRLPYVFVGCTLIHTLS